MLFLDFPDAEIKFYDSCLLAALNQSISKLFVALFFYCYVRLGKSISDG